MTLTKKHYIIAAVLIAIIVVWYFFLRKKKAESSYVKTSATPCSCAECEHLPKGHPLCKTCCSVASAGEESGMKSGAKKCPKGTHPCNSWLTYWRDECCNDTK
jgi:hypothetical protein